MHFGRTLATIVTLIGLGGAARAEMLGGGPVYAGNLSGASISCQIFNFGVSAISINTEGIFTNGGASLSLTTNTCTKALAPTGFCEFAATTVGNVGYLCRLNVLGADENVTGVAEIQNGGAVVAEEPIHK
jgi:hypothetical protein